MKLYIKQKVFSWNDKFTVKDEHGRDKYRVEGELFSFGKKLHVYDMSDKEVAFIQQKLFSFMPRYYVFKGESQVAEIERKISFFTQKYYVGGLDWDVNGDFLAHDYEIVKNGRPIVTMHKEWMTWGDCYELDISPDADEIVSLAVVIAIDCVMASQAAASSAH